MTTLPALSIKSHIPTTFTAGRAWPTPCPSTPQSRLNRLVEEAVQRRGHQAWGDCVMILATTALRISEVAGLQVGDVDLPHGLLTVRRQM
jgi:integrase